MNSEEQEKETSRHQRKKNKKNARKQDISNDDWKPGPGETACQTCHYFRNDPKFYTDGKRPGTTKHICPTKNINHKFVDCPIRTWNRVKAEKYHSSELSELKKKEKLEEKEKKEKEKEEKKQAENERKRKSTPTSDEWLRWKEKNDLHSSEEKSGPEEFKSRTSSVRHFLENKQEVPKDRCGCGKRLQKYSSKVSGTNEGRQFLGCPNGIEGCGFKKWLPANLEGRVKELESRVIDLEDQVRDLCHDLFEMQKIIMGKPFKEQNDSDLENQEQDDEPNHEKLDLSMEDLNLPK